jgi:hypothetical protein
MAVIALKDEKTVVHASKVKRCCGSALVSERIRIQLFSLVRLLIWIQILRGKSMQIRASVERGGKEETWPLYVQIVGN